MELSVMRTLVDNCRPIHYCILCRALCGSCSHVLRYNINSIIDIPPILLAFQTYTVKIKGIVSSFIWCNNATHSWLEINYFDCRYKTSSEVPVAILILDVFLAIMQWIACSNSPRSAIQNFKTLSHVIDISWLLLHT